MEPTVETTEPGIAPIELEEDERKNIQIMEAMVRLGQVGAELYASTIIRAPQFCKTAEKPYDAGIVIQLKDGKTAKANDQISKDRVNVIRYESQVALNQDEFQRLVADNGANTIYTRSNERQRLRADFTLDTHLPPDVPDATTFSKEAGEKLGGHDRLLEKLQGFENAWQACFLLDGTKLAIEYYQKLYNANGISYESDRNGQKYTKTVVKNLESQ